MPDIRKKTDKIIVHCSASAWGDADAIDEWHKARGWAGIGYHAVILNGVRHPDGEYREVDDGLVETGRDINRVGAHCLGHNRTSIGICLIGDRHFTAVQVFTSLSYVLAHCMRMYGLGPDNVFGHRNLDEKKTCPNIGLRHLRDLAKAGLELGDPALFFGAAHGLNEIISRWSKPETK